MNRLSIIAAAAMAVGGLAYVGCDKDESASNTNTGTSTNASGQTAGDRAETAANRTGDNVGNAANRAGDRIEDAADRTGDAIASGTDKAVDATKRAGNRVGDAVGNATDDARQASGRIGQGTEAAPDAEGIRDVIASATEAALKGDGLSDLTERFVDADRNRIGQTIDKLQLDDYNAFVKQFRADWKAKYNQEFDIKEEQAYPNELVSITQGEIGDAAPSGAEVATGQKPGDVDTNKEKGRNIAKVQFAESHGMPAVTVPLIHELPDAWRIDVPDTIDAAKLKANVMAHLKEAHDMKDQWPADVNQASAAVTHHLLEALLDMPAGK